MTEQTAPITPQTGGIGAHLLAFLAGCASGLMFVQMFSGGTLGAILAYLSPLPLFLAALIGGRTAAITATVFGIVAVLLRVPPVFGSIYAVLIAVPTMVIARVALINYAPKDTAPQFASSGTILLTGLTLGTILMLAAAALLQVAGYSMIELTTQLAGGYKTMLAEMSPGLTPEQLDQTIANLPFTLVALLLVGWFAILLVNFLVAQYATREFARAQRPPLAMNELQLPGWLAIVFVLCFATSTFAKPDMAVTLTALSSLYGIGFIFAGLGSAHRWIDARAAQKAWTPKKRRNIYILFYVLVTILYVPVFFLLLAGLIAPFTGRWHHSRTVVADMSGTESKE